MGATITLGTGSEAQLDALLADRIDATDPLDIPIPSDLLGLPPLELVVPADNVPATVTRHIEEGTLPQLVVEVNTHRDKSPTRRVESVSAAKPSSRPWLTDTQPPLLPDISHLTEVEKPYFIQLKER